MNQIRIIFFACLFLLCGSRSLWAETLRGTVKDVITGEPLVGAKVKIVEIGDKGIVLTDTDGRFRVEIASSGRYTVETSYIGYETAIQKEVLVSGAKEVVLEVGLHENTRDLKAVQIRPRVNKESTVNAMSLAGGFMLSMEEATRYAGGANDPARLVAAFAGVSGSSDGNGVSVHGNAPQTLQYRIEGVEVFKPNHFNDLYDANFGMVSALNANVIGNSDFFTSAFNANYSNSLSGIFDVKLRPGNNAKFENIVQVGTVSEEFTSEGPLSRKSNSSYIVNYRYGFTSLADKLGLVGEQDTQYDFQDFSLKLNFPTRKAGTFSVFGLGYYDGSKDKMLDISDVSTIYDASNTDGNVLGLLGGVSHKIHFGRNWTWRTTVAYNAQHVNYDLGYWSLTRQSNNDVLRPLQYAEPRRIHPFSHSKMNEDRVLFNTEVSKQVTPVWLTQFGAEYSHRFFDLNYRSAENVYDAPSTFKTLLNSQGNTGLGGLFWQNLLKPSSRFSINLGLAANYFAFSEDISVEPRVSAKWDFNERNSISAGYGLHSMIERLDAYFLESAGRRLNKDLSFSKAHHLLATYMHKFSDNLNLRLNLFYQYGFDTPVGIGASTFCSVNRLYAYFDEPLVNEGNTRNYGGDITLEHYMSRGFFGQVNFSLFKSEYRALDGVWRSQAFDRGYMLKLLGGKEWMVGRRKQNVLNVSLKYTLQGGLRYTPVDEVAMQNNMAAGIIDDEIIFKDKEAMSRQFRPDNVVDFTVSYKINKKKVSHTIAFEGINMLMSKTPYGLNYDIDRQRVIKDEAGLSLPNLFYRLDF